MFAFLFLLLSLAQAATHTADLEIEIPLNAPPAAMGTQRHGVALGTVESGFPKDTTVTSTWSKLKCRVDEEGNAYVFVVGTNSTWPTAVPTTDPTCTHTYNGDTYVVTIKITAGPDRNWGYQKWHGFTTGWEVDAPAAMTRVRVHVPLPDEDGWTYTEGIWRGKKSGANWDGVWCEVQEVTAGGHFWLIMRTYMGNVTEGTGHCVIKRSGAANYNVPVDINEL